MNHDPFRDTPNYEESAVWVGIRNRHGKQVWITLEDYQRIINDSRARQEAEPGNQAAKCRKKGR